MQDKRDTICGQCGKDITPPLSDKVVNALRDMGMQPLCQEHQRIRNKISDALVNNVINQMER